MKYSNVDPTNSWGERDGGKKEIILNAAHSIKNRIKCLEGKNLYVAG